MIVFSLHLASILSLSTKFHDLSLKNNKSKLCNFCNSRGALDLLTNFSLKFVSIGTILPIGTNLMHKKNAMHDLPWWKMVGCSSIWSSSIWGYTMVSISSNASQTSKKIGINIFFHTYEYFKYLLDNFSYMGGEMFMMLHWEAWVVLGINLNAIRTFNKAYAIFWKDCPFISLYFLKNLCLKVEHVKVWLFRLLNQGLGFVGFSLAKVLSFRRLGFCVGVSVSRWALGFGLQFWFLG